MIEISSCMDRRRCEGAQMSGQRAPPGAANEILRRSFPDTSPKWSQVSVRQVWQTNIQGRVYMAKVSGRIDAWKRVHPGNRCR